MLDDRLDNVNIRYVVSCSLAWAVVLPTGTIMGWILGIFLSKLQSVPWYIEVDWKTNGALIGLIIGAAIGGAYTIHGLRPWLPEINRRHLIITGFGWALALGSLALLSGLLAFD